MNLAPVVQAKPKGEWNLVKVLAGRSIAVKTTRGETHYGLLQSADDTSIVVRIAGSDDFTSQEVAFRRSEVQNQLVEEKHKKQDLIYSI